MVSYLLRQPPGDDDADNPLRVVYMGPLSHVEEFSARFGVDRLHGVRHDRGPRADPDRAQPE